MVRYATYRPGLVAFYTTSRQETDWVNFYNRGTRRGLYNNETKHHILSYTECDLVSIFRLLRVRGLGVVWTPVCAGELNTTTQRPFSRIGRVSQYQKVSILEFTAAGDNGGGGW